MCWRTIQRMLVRAGIRLNVAVGRRPKVVRLKLREPGGMNGAKTRSATLQVRSLRSLGNSSERRAKFYLLYDLLERVSGDVAGTKIGSSGVGSVGHEKKAVDSCREVR